MNRINKLFKEKQHTVLSVYFTAGHPQLDDTTIIIEELTKNGVDMIEIGIPFSDPLADGPVIQQSSHKALMNGMSLKVLFKQLGTIRRKISIPLLLMGYINPVMQYGMENFLEKAKETGMDGIILPDLPLQVYLDEYEEIFIKYEIPLIFLISPQTSNERIRKIDGISKTFIYAVSASSTTGIKHSIAESQETYFKRIKEMGLNNPFLIGFGISNKETFLKACQYSNGAIIGTAFIKALEQPGKLQDTIASFVKKIQ